MAGSSLAHCATTHVPISICLSVFFSFLPSSFSLSLFEMQSYRKRGNNRQEKEEETFHLPVHYSNGHNSQGGARLKPGA